MDYDFLIVGAGLFGSVCARELTNAGHSCIVIDKRDHVGGNCYTKDMDGIQVHMYGPHVFHTDKKHIWEYVNKFDNFLPFELNVLNMSKGKLYHMPINLTTMYELFGTYSVKDIVDIIVKEKQEYIKENGTNTDNLESCTINSVGTTIYNTLIKEYTEKQWQKPCNELDPSIIKRLPLRFTFDNNYFNDAYQGIPEHGYTHVINKLLEGIPIIYKADYNKDRDKWNKVAKYVIYTGSLDEYYDFEFGKLEWRSLRFDIMENQEDTNTPIINYSDKDIPYTRITNHKLFNRYQYISNTILTYEYPEKYNGLNEKYYPIIDKKNIEIYNKYAKKAQEEKNIFFGGRLAEYKYLDMDDVITYAFRLIYNIAKNTLKDF